MMIILTLVLVSASFFKYHIVNHLLAENRNVENSPFLLRNSIYSIFAANVAKNLNSTLRTKFWIKSAYELWQPVLNTNLLTLLSKIFVTMVTI